MTRDEILEAIRVRKRDDEDEFLKILNAAYTHMPGTYLAWTCGVKLEEFASWIGGVTCPHPNLRSVVYESIRQELESPYDGP